MHVKVKKEAVEKADTNRRTDGKEKADAKENSDIKENAEKKENIEKKEDTENIMPEEMQPDSHIRFRVREHWIVPVGGVMILLFTLFILIMGLKYPSAGGNRVIFCSVLLLFFIIGIVCCISGILRGLSVEGMNIQYANWRGRKKYFTLDDIGYCKLVLSSNQHNFIVYDLLGRKLCKLEFEMRGSGEFFQYLLDNQVRVEWKAEQAGESDMSVIEASLRLRETAIFVDEIPKFADALYGKVQDIFSKWERQNKTFDAYWEFGYAEFSAGDLEGKSDLWNRTDSVAEGFAKLPDDYVCILEAYLKKDNEYVIDKKNEPVCLLVPYLVRGVSYQIGERLRLRKMNEETVIHWMEGHLETLAKILPKRKYHTEPLVLKHELRKHAGVRG